MKKEYIAALSLLLFIVSSIVYLLGLSTGILSLPFLRILIWSNIAIIMIIIIAFDLMPEKSIRTYHYINSIKGIILITAIISVLINMRILKDSLYLTMGAFLIGIGIATFIIVNRGNKEI